MKTIPSRREAFWTISIIIIVLLLGLARWAHGQELPKVAAEQAAADAYVNHIADLAAQKTVASLQPVIIAEVKKLAAGNATFARLYDWLKSQSGGTLAVGGYGLLYLVSKKLLDGARLKGWKLPTAIEHIAHLIYNLAFKPKPAAA